MANYILNSVIGKHKFQDVQVYNLVIANYVNHKQMSLRWFLSTALRIPTVQNLTPD